jgi:hypothetical protein
VARSEAAIVGANNDFRNDRLECASFMEDIDFQFSTYIFLTPNPINTLNGNFTTELFMNNGLPNDAAPETRHVPANPSSPRYLVIMFAPNELPTRKIGVWGDIRLDI